jgi:hypothetical protein
MREARRIILGIAHCGESLVTASHDGLNFFGQQLRSSDQSKGSYGDDIGTSQLLA